MYYVKVYTYYIIVVVVVVVTAVDIVEGAECETSLSSHAARLTGDFFPSGLRFYFSQDQRGLFEFFSSLNVALDKLRRR